ncbi:hypothetical protein ONZ45_g9451 [Pleurotus djamor]|nr:hypothetical protein ONZ45_g9451 [Pleurotus djamor]
MQHTNTCAVYKKHKQSRFASRQLALQLRKQQAGEKSRLRSVSLATVAAASAANSSATSSQAYPPVTPFMNADASGDIEMLEATTVPELDDHVGPPEASTASRVTQQDCQQEPRSTHPHPRRLPRHLSDDLPQASSDVQIFGYEDSDTNVLANVQHDRDYRLLPRVVLIVRDRLATSLNPFRLWRHYQHRPHSDPDAYVPLKDLTISRGTSSTLDSDDRMPTSTQDTEDAKEDKPSFWPFANSTRWAMMNWLNTGSVTKSAGEINRLVEEVILAEGRSPRLRCKPRKCSS